MVAMKANGIRGIYPNKKWHKRVLIEVGERWRCMRLELEIKFGYGYGLRRRKMGGKRRTKQYFRDLGGM